MWLNDFIYIYIYNIFILKTSFRQAHLLENLPGCQHSFDIA